MFWGPTFLIDENCKITEPKHFWTWALLRAFCTTFRRKRFIARTRNATDFRFPSLTICRMAKAQKNGKKWVSFDASFTPPCQFFRGFRLFRPSLIFICRTTRVDPNKKNKHRLKDWGPNCVENTGFRSPRKFKSTFSGKPKPVHVGKVHFTAARAASQ
jgi:hypothetical protein